MPENDVSYLIIHRSTIPTAPERRPQSDICQYLEDPPGHRYCHPPLDYI